MLTQGQQPYTPTRLQWLAVALNSMSVIGSTIPMFQKGFSVQYVPESEKDTIHIYFEHPKDLSREQVDRLSASLKNQVLEMIKSEGWDSWVKIEVNEKVSE